MAETKKEPEKILFSKEQIVSSMRYKKYRDFLSGNLEKIDIECISGTSSGSIVATLYSANYSTEEIDKMIDLFYGKGKSGK